MDHLSFKGKTILIITMFMVMLTLFLALRYTPLFNNTPHTSISSNTKTNLQIKPINIQNYMDLFNKDNAPKELFQYLYHRLNDLYQEQGITLYKLYCLGRIC